MLWDAEKKMLQETIKLIHTQTQVFFFYRFVACAFPFFEVKSILPIDRYQNATPRAISLHELKKVQLHEHFTLVTQDSIGHLKTLCMSVISLAVAFESECKPCSSLQSNKKKKMLALEYEFNLIFTLVSVPQQTKPAAHAGKFKDFFFIRL